MVWIEMSRVETHGGGEWAFSKCVWSPSYKRVANKRKKQSWPFWDNILSVVTGDIILHLQKRQDDSVFIGYSIAATDGHITKERPPVPGVWGYSESYYRIFLMDYTEFDSPVKLSSLFSQKKDMLIQYAEERTLPKNIFYTLQKGRLQCLNGAYFSPAEEYLLNLIFDDESKSDKALYIPAKVATSEILRQNRQRSGQNQFACCVKANYHNVCCFPGCRVDDPNFLVAAHIARWADNPELRGDISNGLCFCVLHDRAFELGYFSIDDNYHIMLSNDMTIKASTISQSQLHQANGLPIRLGCILPSKHALTEHRIRCCID